MPFTPTHVAAIIPVAFLGRRWFPFSALAIGAMVPDLPLYLPGALDYQVTHSPAGLVAICLPVGILCFLCFQLIMKRPLIALLSLKLRQRLATFDQPLFRPSLRFFAGVSGAILVGAATHLIWDSFTHQGRWGVRLIPELNLSILYIGGVELRGYKLAQYGSTILGLPAMALLLVHWLGRRRRAPVTPPIMGTRLRRRLICLLLVTTAGLSVVLTMNTEHAPSPSVHRLVGRAVRAMGFSLVMTSLVYCAS